MQIKHLQDLKRNYDRGDILTGEKETMTVNEVPYPVNGKKKYSVLYNGKEYTCYIHPFMSPGYTVCTGNGKDNTFKDITVTRLATEIFLHCK